MTDPQTWTLIVGFLAVTVAMNTLMLRVVRAEIGSVRTELRAELGALRQEMASEFAAVRSDLGHLDRYVQTLYRRMWGGDGPAV